jgi:hypothetical protein
MDKAKKTEASPKDIAGQQESFEKELEFYRAKSLDRKMDRAIKGPPAYSLAEILPRLDDIRLCALYKLRKLGNSEKQSRQQLIDALYARIPNWEDLIAFFSILPVNAWPFMQQALWRKHLLEREYMPRALQMAQDSGYMFLFLHEGRFLCVVPDEVKAAYKAIGSTAFNQEMDVRAWLNGFACAAVNLYGALSLDEFAGLMNDYIKTRRFTAANIKATLSGNAVLGDDYRIVEDCLVSIVLTGDDDLSVDMSLVRSLFEARRGKPRYTPPDPDAFLDYADSTYYEQTPQTAALMDALLSFGLAQEEAEYLMDVLHEYIILENSTEEPLEALEECDVKLSPLQMQRFTGLLTDMTNASRLWSNYGYSPGEIIRIMGKGRPGWNARAMETTNKVAPKTIIPPRKVGRNEPCPCGSGLKYKKCCGKSM